MSLRSRLQQLERSGCVDLKPEDRSAALRGGLEQLLQGAVESNDFGSFFLHHQQMPEAHAHGPLPLRAARTFPAGRLARVISGISGLDTERLLFLDTETTGLSGGTGTYAFLVGLAWFDGGRLCLEQLIMREHVEEKALLEHLRQRLQGCGGLVTYNGKTFDAQLLGTRFLMNRMRVDLRVLPHLDLLHLCRRIWGAVFADCRLETMETEVLGQPRHDDVPGWMVPDIYFRFLRTGDATGLCGVAEHNRRDLLAMVGLVGVLASFVSQPLGPRRALEDCALARLFEELGEQELPRTLLERALRRSLPGERRREAVLRLARLERRAGRRQAAAKLWQGLLREHPHDADACEELAKHLEHHAGDPGLALQLVEGVLRSPRLTPSRRRSFLRRRTRLQRRMARESLPG